MNYRRLVQIFIVALMAQLLSGCGAIIQSAMVGAGKSATIEDTGFLKSYQGLAPNQDPAHPSLPDLNYVSPQVHMSAYNKIIMLDFTSITPDIDKLKGLQIRQYKDIKKELPDLIASTFDGSAFSKVTRVSERIDPKDIAAIKRLPADAVLMGNIKELQSLGGEGRAGLTAIQIEYKLIDTRSGEEVVTAIHRSTTDLDKVAMGQVRVLQGLLNKAKAIKTTASVDLGQRMAPAVAATASPAPAKVVVATAPAASGAVATVSYQELVKIFADDSGDPRKVYGKTVQVAVSGKGEIGYFAKKSDGITFVCKSGDKTLTANKATKGSIRGIVSDSENWEGATVYHLKDCQIVK
jgi:hypothetical protein